MMVPCMTVPFLSSICTVSLLSFIRNLHDGPHTLSRLIALRAHVGISRGTYVLLAAILLSVSHLTNFTMMPDAGPRGPGCLLRLYWCKKCPIFLATPCSPSGLSHALADKIVQKRVDHNRGKCLYRDRQAPLPAAEVLQQGR